jgi:FtsP/CotA-like multicopper oxidase with cupredoxin domain
MTISRRMLLQSGLAAGAVVAGARMVAARPDDMPMPGDDEAPAEPMTLTSGRAVAGEAYTPVVVPNGATLPFVKKAGVKVFHLIAEPVTHTIAPGLEIEAWGYNGRTPGPLIEAVEGDRVRIYVTNKLPEPTTVHWHGLFLPAGMDGVAGLTQPVIPVGKTFRYEFDLVKAGTFMYHPHFDEMTQIALGMVGMFVVHPKTSKDKRRVRDYSLMAHEWKNPDRHAPSRSDGDERLQRPHLQQQGIPGHRAAGRRGRRSSPDPARQPRSDGSPPDPPARLRVRGHLH